MKRYATIMILSLAVILTAGADCAFDAGADPDITADCAFDADLSGYRCTGTVPGIWPGTELTGELTIR